MEYSGPPPFQPQGPPPPPALSSPPVSRRILVAWRVGVVVAACVTWYAVALLTAVFIVGLSTDPVLYRVVGEPGPVAQWVMLVAVGVWLASLLPRLSRRVRLVMILGSGVTMVVTPLGWFAWVLVRFESV